MSRTEDDSKNEVPREQQVEVATFENVFVPGIGVRDALGDDDLEDSDFWRGVREGWTRRATSARGCILWTMRHALAAVRVAGKRWDSIRDYRPKRLTWAPTGTEAIARIVRKVRPFSSSALARISNRVRSTASHIADFRVSASYRLDLHALQEAVPALVVLLVMVVFVIQATGLFTRH